ncbi:MAG TPA: ADOP family duplicated permease [Lacunisphaera sp.]|nr:ADOP family duplicated permease [Lacunisphaera sp.]
MSAEFLRWLALRWRGLFARDRHEASMDREMQFHLDMLVQENLAAGMTPEEARAAAQREFGGAAQYREECRDTWRPAAVSGLAGDFAYAVRSLRRSPGFTAVAVFTLALGIGVNVVMFSFVRDSILRPFLRDRNLNLVALYNARADTGRNFRYFSHPEFVALRESHEVFADVAALGLHVGAIGPEHNLQRRFIGLASENFFSLLDVKPAQGRFFTAEESQPDAAAAVVVANHALWDRLGRPANFIGSTLWLEGRPYTVIGMTPPGFVGLHVSIGPDAWVPLGIARQLTGGADFTKPTETRLTLVGRLQPGLSLASVTGRLEAVDRRLNALPPADSLGARRLVLAPPARTDLGNVGPESEVPLGLFGVLALGLTLLVLLVACLNLANMFLARGVARYKEIAIRLALGASRWRVVRGLVAEGLLIGLLGGTLSVVLGQWCSDFMVSWSHDAFAAGKFALQSVPFVDGKLIVATLVFSLLAPLAFSLWPAWRITRADLYPDLKQIAGAPPVSPARRGWLTLGDVPLLAQIALSLTLIFSATLFVRAARNVRTIDLGFHPDHQLAVQLDYNLATIDTAQIRPRQQELLASARTLPGVTATALSSNVPYNFDLSTRAVRAAAGDSTVLTDPKNPNQRAGYTAVTRGYFTLLGIELLQGRDFTPEESDGSSAHQVAVIDVSLARKLFGEVEPVGRRLMVNPKANGDGTLIEVVGIIRSPRNDAFGPVPLRIYRPLGQAPEANVYLHLQVPEPLALVDTLRKHLQAVAPEVPILLLRPFSDFVDKNINVLLVQLVGVIFGGSGGIALVLAVVGVYGVKAHATARRAREIGVRLALGARPRDVLMLILKQGLIQAGLGLAAGMGLALAAGAGLSSMLYRVNPFDPVALLGCAALLGAAVLLACWIPARRATKVDPLVAIRAE